jgi:hypothetical protein
MKEASPAIEFFSVKQPGYHQDTRQLDACLVVIPAHYRPNLADESISHTGKLKQASASDRRINARELSHCHSNFASLTIRRLLPKAN